MSLELQQLQAAIVALEGQRSLLGDAVVEPLLAAARARVDALQSSIEPEPAQSLKQVSILFLDAVGSTMLSQKLDPEETSAVMDGALARGSALVEAHQGKVLQYAGDNLLAVFGADNAREDDAERAVRCGLALLELGMVLRREIETAHGHAGFNVRVGIHTGGVLLGGGVDAEGTIRGIAVNIAARMEQTAPAGALRISHDTYAQVRGMFEVERAAAAAGQGLRRAGAQLSRRSAPSRARSVSARAASKVWPRAWSAATPSSGAAARLRAALRGEESDGGDRGRRSRHRQEPLALRVRSLVRSPTGELLPLSRAGHAADPEPAVRPAARHPRLALPDRRRRHARCGQGQARTRHRPALRA